MRLRSWETVPAAVGGSRKRGRVCSHPGSAVDFCPLAAPSPQPPFRKSRFQTPIRSADSLFLVVAIPSRLRYDGRTALSFALVPALSGEEVCMNRGLPAAFLGALLLFSAACKSKTDEKDAIRAGIIQHLTSLNILNLNNMDIVVTGATVTGDRAEARVDVRAKNSDAGAAAMQLNYSLEKHSGEWVVVKSQPMGGMQHPAPGDMPSGTMPPGHPNVNGGGQSSGHSDFNDILKTAQPPAPQQPAAQQQTKSSTAHP